MNPPGPHDGPFGGVSRRDDEETNVSADANEPAGGWPSTDDDIARRAYEISLGENAGTPEENWLEAERELRGSNSDAASDAVQQPVDL
jgi:hypothetical protein